MIAPSQPEPSQRSETVAEKTCGSGRQGCGGQFPPDPNLAGQQGPNTDKHQGHAAQKPDKLKKFWRDAKRHWQERPIDFVAVFVALILTAFTGCQWRASVSALKTSERAWVYPADFMYADPDENTRVVVSTRLVNSGRSPASNVRVQRNLDFFPTKSDPGEPDWNRAETSQPFLLFPTPEYLDADAAKTIPAQRSVVTNTIGPERMADYTAKDLSAYVRVRVIYTDIFGDDHWTTRCLYHISAQDPATFTPCDTGNDFGTFGWWQ